MNQTKILIISDVHLGRENCNIKALLEILTSYSFEKLIILGDLFEKRAMISQLEFLEYLQKIAAKITYINGNHDPSNEFLAERLIGVKPVRKFEWLMGNKKFCAMHGH